MIAEIQRFRDEGVRSLSAAEMLLRLEHGDMRVCQLADAAGVLRSNICAQLDVLVREGWVERRARRDRFEQAVSVGLTPKGRSLVGRVRGRRSRRP